jgi:hypothetical protein
MVKGISRRVIVVKSPDPKVFEEAIFIIREDFLSQPGVSSDRVMKEAQEVADGYMRSISSRSKRLMSRIPAPVLAAAGAAATGIAWIALRLAGV